jgi:hypothetical protein
MTTRPFGSGTWDFASEDPLLAQRDAARDMAVRLEQELAETRRLLTALRDRSVTRRLARSRRARTWTARRRVW